LRRRKLTLMERETLDPNSPSNWCTLLVDSLSNDDSIAAWVNPNPTKAAGLARRQPLVEFGVPLIV
jgi:hypothetical protein